MCESRHRAVPQLEHTGCNQFGTSEKRIAAAVGGNAHAVRPDGKNSTGPRPTSNSARWCAVEGEDRIGACEFRMGPEAGIPLPKLAAVDFIGSKCAISSSNNGNFLNRASLRQCITAEQPSSNCKLDEERRHCHDRCSSQCEGTKARFRCSDVGAAKYIHEAPADATQDPTYRYSCPAQGSPQRRRRLRCERYVCLLRQAPVGTNQSSEGLSNFRLTKSGRVRGAGNAVAQFTCRLIDPRLVHQVSA